MMASKRWQALAKRKGARRILLIAVLMLAAWVPLAWVAAEKLIVEADLDRADAIVVLSGSQAYVERARRAAQLYHEGRAARIILTNDSQQSGWSVERQRNPLFMERAADELKLAGVPEDAIQMLPEVVASTHEEAQLLREYTQAHGLRSILVVTSAYHSRRALWAWRNVFAGQNIRIGVDAVPPGDQTPPAATWWLHARGWPMVAAEYVKLVYYRYQYG